MASFGGMKSNMCQLLIILLSCSMVFPFSITATMNASDLLKYLKKSMAKVENSLTSDKKYLVLHRRVKNRLLRYYDATPNYYVGKAAAQKQDSLNESPQLEIDEAYRNFLRNHLHVPSDRRLPPNFRIKNPASIEHKRKLFCKSGYLVEILPNGTVRGTQDHTSPYTRLTILMYSRQLIIIRTEKPPFRYLVMAEDSKVRAIEHPTIQSVFFYRVGSKVDRHNHLTFQKAYRRRKNWFLALRKRDRGEYGTVKKGKNSNPSKRSAQFIAVRY